MSRLWIAGLLLLPVPGFAQADVKPGAIEGSVINEITGEPVNRVVVTATRMMDGRTARAGDFSAMAGPPQGISAYTDAEGKFRLVNVEPGRYMVSARKRGFVDPRPGTVRPMNQVNVEPGQTKGGLQYKLVPQGIIAGRVFDEAGEPVQNAQVRALQRRRMNGRMQWTGTQGNATTNDRGEYRLSGLSAGQYAVVADLREYFEMGATSAAGRQEVYVTTFFPQAGDQSGAQLVEVSAGNETGGIDIHMQKDATFKIRGRVTGVPGDAGRGFSVQAMPRDMSPMNMGMRGATSIGPNATFQISSVRRGSYMLMAQTNGPEGERLVGVTPVDVSSDDISDVVIALGPGIRIGGTFVLEGQGEKMNWPSFNVQLRTREGMMYGGMRPGRVTEDGAFTALVDMPVKYLINVNGPTPGNAYLASIRVGSEEYLGREIDFSNGSPGPIRIIYRTDGGKVRGTAERLEGAESGASEMVVLMPKEQTLRQFPFIQVRPMRPDGSFEFSNVRPGEYMAWAVQGFDYSAFDGGDLPKELEDSAAKVRVDPSGNQSLQLKEIKAPKME